MEKFTGALLVAAVMAVVGSLFWANGYEESLFEAGRQLTGWGQFGIVLVAVSNLVGLYGLIGLAVWHATEPLRKSALAEK